MRLALLLTLASQAIFSQTPACDGNIVIVRVSEIKPGHMDGFMAAVEAHKAWYRANGIKDNEMVVSRVIVRDKDGTQSYSDKEVLTYHVNPPGPARTPNRGDAAWNAYVKQYRDSSDLKSEYMTCMPKHSMPSGH
ncbi:MAG TPA: hypothetical protein VKR43_24050 [Bryobacteraceae bacterium]|nr:hypothetical protein [Bryobacteraceae bacterium]